MVHMIELRDFMSSIDIEKESYHGYQVTMVTNK